MLAIRDQALQLSQASLTAAPEQALVLEVLIALYQATAEARWLLEAEKLVDKILHISGVSPCNKTACISALPLALSTLDLHHLTGDLSYKQYSLHVLDAVLTEVATIDPLFAVEAYVLYQRVHAKPFHMTVVGLKADPAAQQLFTLARAAPVAYRRLEWWDRTQGTLPNADVRYPILKRAAAFICVERHCSLPLFSEADMRHALLRIFNKS